MKIPRPHQHQIVDSLFDYICTKDGDPVIASPTGTGKSLAICMFIKKVVEGWPGTRVMCVTHSKKIIRQNAQAMLEHWPEADVGVYSAALKRRDKHNKILFTSVDSVQKRAEDFGPIDFLIIDEAHMVAPREGSRYHKLREGLRKVNPHLRVPGFSATPYRLGMGMITDGELFTEVCLDLTTTERFNQFVTDEHLCRLVTKNARGNVDVSQVHIKGGEFDKNEVAALFDTADVNAAVVDEVIRHGQDRNHWMGFAASVKHAENLVREFLSRGVSAIAVDGELEDEEEDRRFAAFEAGQYRALVVVGIGTTGYDFPALDLIFVARATQSTGLWIQILGRGTRMSPGKESCLILDFGGNCGRLGPINAPVIPRAKKKGEGTGKAPVKECPVCQTMCHTKIAECPECGHNFPPSSCLEASASTLQVMVEVAEVPIFETCKVFQTVYAAHDSKPKVPGGECNQCVRVSYSLGITAVTQYHVFKNHPFFEGKIAKFWRTLRGHSPVPKTRDEFLQRTGELTSPKEITIISNKKYPEVTEIIMP